MKTHVTCTTIDDKKYWIISSEKLSIAIRPHLVIPGDPADDLVVLDELAGIYGFSLTGLTRLQIGYLRALANKAGYNFADILAMRPDAWLNARNFLSSRAAACAGGQDGGDVRQHVQRVHVTNQPDLVRKLMKDHWKEQLA